MQYLSEGELYSIWKYLNGHRLVHRNGGILNFDDLTASGESKHFLAKFFNLLKGLGITRLEKLVFHRDIYEKYHKKGVEELKQKVKTGELKGFSAKHLEFLESISADPYTLLDDDLGIYDFLFYEGALGVLEFFEFSDYLTPKNKKALSGFVDKYITNFQGDSLEKDTENFYRFDKQKETLIRKLRSLEEKYGKSFILEYPENIELVLGTDKEYLFIHTLITLEKLGYFAIEKIWIFDMDLPPEKQTESYKIKLRLEEKYFEERTSSPLHALYSKEQKNKVLGFNEKNSLLQFNGKEITISKTRNSNAHYLLQTLFKDKSKIWEFDEVAEDWGEEYKKRDWGRYYNAAYKVNEKIAKDTTIKDFLSITNKTVAIQKKYL